MWSLAYRKSGDWKEFDLVFLVANFLFFTGLQPRFQFYTFTFIQQLNCFLVSVIISLTCRLIPFENSFHHPWQQNLQKMEVDWGFRIQYSLPLLLITLSFIELYDSNTNPQKRKSFYLMLGKCLLTQLQLLWLDKHCKCLCLSGHQKQHFLL